MTTFKNGRLSNGLGILILVITAVIAVNQMNSVKNKIRDMAAPPKASRVKPNIAIPKRAYWVKTLKDTNEATDAVTLPPFPSEKSLINLHLFKNS